MDLELASVGDIVDELVGRGLSGVIAVWDDSDGARGKIRVFGDPAAASGVARLACAEAADTLADQFTDEFAGGDDDAGEG